VDILVNNAGNATSNRLGRTALEEWNRLFAVNATSTFLCTRAVFDGMAERGRGRVVNVASMAGLEGKRYVSAYTAAKHAVIGLTRAVAAEADGTGVQVSAVCPGYVDTPLTEATVARVVDRTGKSPAEALRAVLDAAGQDRLVTMEEVAAAVLDLCADGSESRNGELVILDGKEGLPMTFEHINPDALGEPKGWTNGMLGPEGGRVLFIAGQDAAEPEGEVATDDFTVQFGLALEKTMAIVEEAGGRAEDIGRMTIFVTDLDVYRAERRRLGDVYRATMGKHFPAMALVEVKRLVDPRALVEIEATAVIPASRHSLNRMHP
jgi:enamine deaminase RidA (YjgF/YER057c/UK114 family)